MAGVGEMYMENDVRPLDRFRLMFKKSWFLEMCLSARDVYYVVQYEFRHNLR